MKSEKIGLMLITPIVMVLMTVLASCESEVEDPLPISDIEYKTDGRTASLIAPVILDINEDGKVDYNIFCELTSTASGDHLYFGINPIGEHLIKSGPGMESHFLNMGFLIAEEDKAIIDNTLKINQRWTADHSIIAIRHTATNNSITYEGGWADSGTKVVGIQFITDGGTHFGWLRFRLNKEKEEMILIDYAYEKITDMHIRAGETQ